MDVLEAEDAGQDDEEEEEEEEEGVCSALLPRLLLPNKGLLGLGEGVVKAWLKERTVVPATRRTVVVGFIFLSCGFPYERSEAREGSKRIGRRSCLCVRVGGGRGGGMSLCFGECAWSLQ